MTEIDKTLEERGTRYGTFEGHAAVSQRLKQVIREELEARRKELPPNQMEAFEMICHKMARIINGDHNYADSWHDIAGYAGLIDKQLCGESI